MQELENKCRCNIHIYHYVSYSYSAVNLEKDSRCNGSKALIFGQEGESSASYAEIRPKTDISERESYTIMCWIKLKRYNTKTDSYQVILADLTTQKYMFAIIHGGKLSLNSRVFGKSTLRLKEAHERVRLHKWVHTAATWDGYEIKLYVDGKEMDGNTLDSSLKNEGSFESETAYIGGYPGLHQFNGSIMDLFVIGTALSRANIMSVFKGEFINKKLEKRWIWIWRRHFNGVSNPNNFLPGRI